MEMTMSSLRPTRLEVVTSVQRRRRWTPEQQLEIVNKPMYQEALYHWYPANMDRLQPSCFNGAKHIWKVPW
jgi:hypothetical protein